MNLSILLVDDEPQILKCVRSALHPLEKDKIVIRTSTSAEEAIELINKFQIDVVITDENMTGMSGTELLAWISKNYPETKKIVLTGDNLLSTAIRAINQGGVDAYLTKPFKNSVLLDTIHGVLLTKDRETRIRAIRESIIQDLTAQVEKQTANNFVAFET
ncbi:MAG: response regulator [Planctomycetes bacterium]|nr:response regulator [Planctomycetota bacterium]MCH9724810.1 response regulator [Planctomycetota bacterium]MCH9778750.1 response regulator [Planctomycetota bacterium]MCH9790339.1 response regulator [Planctomycetota bacterium]